MVVQEIIDIIETTYNSSDLIYEIMLAHFSSLSGIGFHTIPMKKGSVIFRARYSDKIVSFIELSNISYPKKHFVNNFSRLNRPHQNIFYASETERGCLSEMLPFWLDEFKTGDKIMVTLGKWEVTNDLKLLIIPDTTNSSELNKRTISQLNSEEIQFWDYISRKYKITTKEDKNIYEFTSAFANALWLTSKRQNINNHGFIYSSVQSKLDLNIALNVDLVDTERLIPLNFTERVFQKTGYNKFGLPTYIEINSRKMGVLNSDKSHIDWI
jgi:hypothetical protein